MKVTMLRLPDAIGHELDKIAKKKGLPFATFVKEIVCEYVNTLPNAETKAGGAQQ